MTLSAFSQRSSTGHQIFQPGEELRYKVKWSFVRLGTITIRTEEDSSDGEGKSYRISMEVKSNPALFFIKIRDHNESLVNAASLMSKFYRGKHCKGEHCTEISIQYDEAQQLVYYYQTFTEREKEPRADTLQNVPPYVDGAALLFFTRGVSHTEAVFNVPTITQGQIRNTLLDFSGPVEEIEIDAYDAPIRTRRYSGFADWKGGTSAGLSGEFAGWISDDEIAVPIRAKMKVLIGSVKIELEGWNRPGWVPPTGLSVSAR